MVGILAMRRTADRALCRAWAQLGEFHIFQGSNPVQGLGSEEVFVFDSKSENRDKTVEVVQ